MSISSLNVSPQAYVASLGASLSPSPAYQQLAAASRLASLHRSLLGTNPNTEGQPGTSQEKKRTASQFSIDELLRQDDKKGRFETDSKSISVDEVDDTEESAEEAVRVKMESSSPGDVASQ